MHYRLIHKVCSTKTEANASLKKVKDKARNPQVVFSSTSGAWVVQLCEVNTRDEAENAFMYFRKVGVTANIQKVNEDK